MPGRIQIGQRPRTVSNPPLPSIGPAVGTTPSAGGMAAPPAQLPAVALNSLPSAGGMGSLQSYMPALTMNPLPSAGSTAAPPAQLSAAVLNLRPGSGAGQAAAGGRKIQPSAALLATQRARQAAGSAAGQAASGRQSPQSGQAQPAQTGTSVVDIPPPSTPPPAQRTQSSQQAPIGPPTTPPPANQPVGAPSTPPPAATVTLDAVQKTRLKDIKKTLVGRKCEQMGQSISGGQLSGDWALEDEARNNPDFARAPAPSQSQNQPQGQQAAQANQPRSKRKRFVGMMKRVGQKLSGVVDWGKDSVVDVGAPALDIASGAVDYAGGGSERSWLHVANKGEKNAWGDGKMQSEGIPIAGAVIKSINCLVRAGKLAINIKDYFKEHKEGGHTGNERWEMLMTTVSAIQDLLDTVMSWHGAFTTFLGQLPVIGSIIGAVNAGIGLVEDAIRVGLADHYIRHMKEQKRAAKATIKARQDAVGGGFTHMVDRRTGFMYLHKETREKIKREFDPVQPPQSGQTGQTGQSGQSAQSGGGRVRRQRLDERTKQLRANLSSASGGQVPAAPAGQTGAGPGNTASAEVQETVIRALEDYDVTQEITEANEHRRREGITKIILNDIVGFGTALAAMDPTGLGSSIGAAVTAAVNAGFFVQKTVGAVRQKMRETGAMGANMNKSDENKKLRRHNLAVVMYDRIKELAETDVATINDAPPTAAILAAAASNTGAAAAPAAAAAAAAAAPITATPQQASRLTEENKNKFLQLDERVRAMGVSGPFLRSKDAVEMVKAMRKGFYRDV